MKAGDQIDRYTILAPLGRGGMGDVYKAHDRRLHRNVALKVLRVDPEDEVPRAEVVARMFREARAAAALEHPNVVVIHDVGEVTLEGEAEPTCFIAMELIEGDVLRNFIGRTDVSVEEKVRWLLDVARALAFAHERGIVHRDVKPDNVILRDDGVVKVLDFGIARRAHGVDKGATGGGALPTLTGKGLTLGTPKYMSPEQMLNEDLDGRADQYAWGVVAYELLSGRSPWSGSTDSLQFVAEVLTRQPEPLSSRAPRVPKDVADVVERAMAKKKDERFPTMLELIAALDGSRPPIASLRKMTPARPTAPEDATLRAQQSTRPNPAATLGSPVEPRRIGAAKIAAAAGTLGLVAVLAFVSFRSREVAPVPSAHVQGRACASNAACSTKLGAPALCRARDGTCVQLASEDCRVAAEPSDLENPATIWVGAMFPLTGEDAASFGDREFQAVDLARADFAHLMAGANARPGGARPLAVLACDDARDQARAARHLVTDVEVPAIIGFRSSNEAIELATSTLIPKGILGVAALNTSPMITSLPRMPGEPRMIWRTTYSGAEAALPISLVVPDVIEGEVRKTLGRSEPLRVALVRQDDAAGLGFADILFRNLRFNGRSALENEASYREFAYAAPSAGGKKDDYDTIAARVLSFAPHVVIDFGGDEPFLGIATPLERDWKGGHVRPRYLKASVYGPSVLSFLGQSAERRRRFFSVTSVSTTAANARFVSRYNEANPPADGGAPVSRTFSPNSSYDAFYLVAYATYALGTKPVSGANLARAIPRLLPPGRLVDVGPSAIFDGLNALAAGANIDLNGATGPLDFDVETGEAPVDLALLCVTADANGVAAGTSESGLVYDATSHKLRGTLRCP